MSVSTRKPRRGSAWKVVAAAALITGALAGPAVAVDLPLPAREHGNASSHVPITKEPVLAGSRWGGVAWK